ncbi:TIGR02117 family protein [Nibribacter koreensis]|uniref:TIGR02117 family protein n=2 Tax=Nibribacter koreensis TaxID=1084519 RepID=A0ABP8F8T3_9BACT
MIAGYVFLSICAFVLVYFLVAFILSRWGVDKEPQTRQEVTMYILTNGVHTDLVVPVKHELFDWNKFINYQHTKGKDSTHNWVAFGWGDKGFYLETPTWADLKVSTAFKAATGLSNSAIHATFYKDMQESADCKRIQISVQQYNRLIKFIKTRFDLDAKGKPIHIQTNANYGLNDAFYEAKGSYNLFYTCNTWANNGLKASGQKASIWTPFYQGIFYQYQ